MIIYRRYRPPGCGSLLLILALVLLVFGGAPMLLKGLGVFLLALLLFVLMGMAGVWGLFWYIRRTVRAYQRSQSESHNLFVFLLVNILVKVAQADGTVTGREIDTIVGFFRRHLHYQQGGLHWVRQLVKEAMASETPLEALLAEFKSRFAYEPRLILLELIYQVLFSNPEVSPQELALVQRIAEFLGIGAYDHLSIKGRYVSGGRRAGGWGGERPDADHSAYAVLGLEPGVGLEEIKAAYRKLSMQYHPDKVAHLGEEFRQVAEEKMKEINAAYQQLKKRLGSDLSS